MLAEGKGLNQVRSNAKSVSEGVFVFALVSGVALSSVSGCFGGFVCE